MSELDKAVQRFKMRAEAEKGQYRQEKKKNCMDFFIRSGLTAEEFYSRKSAGKYAWK